MDFSRSFSFIIEDKYWFKKVGIAALLFLTGIGWIVAFGWVIEIVRRVTTEDPEPLPGWEDIGDYLINGLKFFGVLLIWSIPILMITLCFTIFLIPSSDCYSASCYVNFSEMIPILCVSILIIIYSIFIGLLSTPLFGLIGEGLSFKELLNPKLSYIVLNSNIFVFVGASLAGGLISSFLSTIGILACFVGAFFGSAFGYAVMGHLIGQAHKQARENLDAYLNFEE